MFSHSWKKIDYTLRPIKQVERKLFIEGLHCLSKGGYDVSNYRYLGFGSIFYFDFVLFHKYLYIDKMTCLEGDNISKRMKFNCPFGFIDVRMEKAADYLLNINRQKPYIVWLDYDGPLNRDVLNDIDGFIHALMPGSIFIVTIDASRKDLQTNEIISPDKSKDLLESYIAEFGEYLPANTKVSDVSKTRLPNLLAKVIRSKIQTSVSRRESVAFYQLFNLVYSDGTPMLTLGGLIGGRDDKLNLAKTKIYQKEFVTEKEKPLEIAIPHLTIRERFWLEKKASHRERVKKTPFNLPTRDVQGYLKYYRYHPFYYEALL